ncbi:DUF305 domain-containing protein [Candidatus Saccharibacteria bacterium]|nr:DUF305 domain-containing protein [Candidatus Saccharibacteria bacterium]
METKSLLFGLIGFMLGGLLVSVAATSAGKTETATNQSNILMNEMTESLKDLKGDEYDKKFIAHMIDHHQGAIDMAKLSEERAKHDEIKKLSNNIISTQEMEISEMKKWQSNWGYSPSNGSHSMSEH